MTTLFQAIPWRGAWAVRCAGAPRVRSLGLSRDQAWREARRLARRAKGTAFLFSVSGRIYTCNRYGNA